LAERSQHDHLDVLETFGVAHNVEHLETADARHHHVGYNKVGQFLLGYYQSGFTIGRRDYLIPFRLQACFIDFPQVIVVFDQKDFCHF
jgi:hypothetical protein